MLIHESTSTKPTFWNGTNLPCRDLLSPENLVEARNKELLAEKKMRELFVITLSHDLRGPLATARMSAELLESSFENNSEVIKFAEIISRNIDLADRMIRDLLDANQIGAGEKTLANPGNQQ